MRNLFTRDNVALRRYQKIMIWIVSFVTVIAIWQILSITGIVNSLLLPPPAKIAETFARLLSSGKMFYDIGISTARIIFGFSVAFFFAVPLGLVAGSSEYVRNYLKPWVQLMQPIPGIAWVPFAFLLFGLSNNAAIFVIAVAAFFPIFINIMNAVQRFDRDLINVARTLGASNFQVLSMILLPGIVPDMITGSRVGMGFAWRAVVAAEMIGLTQGVGSLLIEAKNTAQTDVVIVSMATLGVLMVIFEKVIFESLERRIDRWKGAQAE